VLAQTKVSGKSNEITAIPELLKMIDLKDSVVTIDAMGCQRDIAQNITESGADYVLALKGNQGNLQKSVKILFAQEQSLKELSSSIHTQNNRGHGRSETRTCTVINAPELLQKSTKWPGLKTLVEINSTRILKNKTESEKRYYVSSLQADAEQMLHTIRSHWSIENQLHYILDVSFQDDASRIRKGNAPMNMGIVKHIALNLIRVNQGKRESIKGLRKIAGWSNQRLSQIVFGMDAAKSQDE
jgi:predicted transposase YbfD/YdcC